MESAKPKVKSEFEYVKTRLVFSNATWKHLEFAIRVLTPLRVALRTTDTDSPNLPQSVAAFFIAKEDSLKVADDDGNLMGMGQAW